MSTRDGEVMDAVLVDAVRVDAPAPDAAVETHPTPSTALVPLTMDRAPLRATWHAAEARPQRLHVVFFGLWYAGVALLTLAAWMEPRSTDAMFGFYLLGGFLMAMGALGLLVYVLYKPGMQKLRRVLGAGAALALTIAARPAVQHVAHEVHASARVARLQPLADDLVRDGRIRTLDISREGYVELNGSRSALNGSMAEGVEGEGAPLLIGDLLRRDRLTEADLQAHMDRLRQAGVQRVEVRDGHVAFASDGTTYDLLYLRPAHGLSSVTYPVLGGWDERMRPVGGGWYLHGAGGPR